MGEETLSEQRRARAAVGEEGWRSGRSKAACVRAMASGPVAAVVEWAC